MTPNREPNRPGNPLRARKRVALFVPTVAECGRAVLRGIQRFLHQNANWEVFLAGQETNYSGIDLLSRWKGDGVLIGLTTGFPPPMLRALKKRGPIIGVGSPSDFPGIPVINPDHFAIGRMAADALLKRGFARFAFLGDARFEWSRLRSEGFASQVAEAGYLCDILSVPPDVAVESDRIRHFELVSRWIEGLQRPVGVMACNDINGQEFLEAAASAKIAVPQEIAVIGVDNDELLCSITHPPLSSVIPNFERMGFDAATLLNRWMSGEKPPSDFCQMIPPSGVAERLSTESIAVPDPIVTRALAFIFDQARNGINVADVVNHARISRRALELRFAKWLRCTPHDALWRVRIRMVKEFLANTNLTLEDIAERAGFAHEEYLSAAFKRSEGITPSAYRASHRHPGNP